MANANPALAAAARSVLDSLQVYQALAASNVPVDVRAPLLHKAIDSAVRRVLHVPLRGAIRGAHNRC